MNLPPPSSLTYAKFRAIVQKMADLKVNLADIEESFVRGSGKGGQKINKTASAVQLKHLPTGIMIKYQKHRERAMNRILGLRDLLDKLAPDQKVSKIAKIRKQKARRKRRAEVNF